MVPFAKKGAGRIGEFVGPHDDPNGPEGTKVSLDSKVRMPAGRSSV